VCPNAPPHPVRRRSHCVFRSVRDWVSHPYRTTGKVIVAEFNVLLISLCRWADFVEMFHYRLSLCRLSQPTEFCCPWGSVHILHRCQMNISGFIWARWVHIFTGRVGCEHVMIPIQFSVCSNCIFPNDHDVKRFINYYHFVEMKYIFDWATCVGLLTVILLRSLMTLNYT
jgi:hypothetical protein